MKRTRFQRIIRTHLSHSKGRLGVAAFCVIGFTLADLLSPWPLKIIFDHILLDKPWPASLSPLAGVFKHDKVIAAITVSAGILLIAAFKGLFAYLQLYLTSRTGFQLVYILRRELFAHLQRLSLSFHNRAHAGELLTKVTADTNTLKDVFAGSILDFAGQILTLVGMFGILFWLNWRLSLVVWITFPPLAYAIFTIYRRTKISARAQRESEGRLASRISEVLGSLLLVRAFARESYEEERFEEESSQTFEESVRTARVEAAASRTIEIINAFGVWATVLFGSLMALRGQMTPGEVLIFTAYLTGMYKPLRNLAKLSTQISKAMVSAERISAILEVDHEPDTGAEIAVSTRLKGQIVFSNVSFHYGDGNAALNGVSFTIEPGQRVALVGASGAGKSTIASLILRFYDPQAGRILIDGADVRNYHRASLRGEIGVVLQDSLLFGTSIRENIAYGRPDATAEEIEAAARQASAHHFITALPEGYETILGERGCTLSGGQRQRLCLARAIIRTPSILILDEPTASVDAESAALIQKALERLQRGKTTLVIAHHFIDMESFDQILVLKRGGIVEQGSHTELLKRQGYYSELCRLQTLEESSSLPRPTSLLEAHSR